MTTNDTKPLKIHVGITGGVRVDADNFFDQENVKERLKKMEEIHIVGKKLDDKTLFPKTPEKL